MLDFLLDHSVHIIGFIVFIFMAVSETRRYMKKNKMSCSDLTSKIRLNINEVGEELIPKLLSSVAVSTLISIISFRELWMNDTFHIVFLSSLLLGPANKYIKQLFK